MKPTLLLVLALALPINAAPRPHARPKPDVVVYTPYAETALTEAIEQWRAVNENYRAELGDAPYLLGTYDAYLLAIPYLYAFGDEWETRPDLQEYDECQLLICASFAEQGRWRAYLDHDAAGYAYYDGAVTAFYDILAWMNAYSSYAVPGTLHQ